ncbi:cell division protein FtsA [Sphingorhabdus sp.]|uniref:cell division protein FtsA n=1 Tax=Sphingorhabdus sp. TaxID=1902408 RepID=UPI0035935365
MKAARVEKLISAIDIGSSKVSALIAGQTDSGELLVLGTGQRESRGVTRGCIADIEQAELSVRHAVEQAERIAGINIERVWVGMSSGGLDSLLAPVEIELGGDRITQDDVDQLLQAGRANIQTGGKMPLHIQPTLYALDGVGGVANPVGLHADRLGVDIHVVLADQSPVRNIDMTVRAAHLDVEAIVVAPIATGFACLTSEERELGVALVEFGASITNVSVFIGGMLVGLETIQKGASDITDDIASAFGIRRAQAERLKCFHGSALTSPRDHQEILDVGPDENGNEAAAHASKITKAQLNAVVCQRVDGIVGEIGRALKALGFSGPSSHQIVLTGGGAELKGIAEHMQGALGRTVRIGKPSGLSGIPEAHSGPAFSTLVGLIQYAAFDRVDLKSGYELHGEHMVGGMPNLFERIKRAIRENF